MKARPRPPTPHADGISGFVVLGVFFALIFQASIVKGFSIHFLKEIGTYEDFLTPDGIKVNWTIDASNSSLDDFSFYLLSISFQGVFSDATRDLNASSVNWTCYACRAPDSDWGETRLQLFRIVPWPVENDNATTLPPPPPPSETSNLQRTTLPEPLVNSSRLLLLTATFSSMTRSLLESRSGKVTFRASMSRIGGDDDDGNLVSSDVSVVILEPEPISMKAVAAIAAGVAFSVIFVGWKIHSKCFAKKKPKRQESKE